LEEKKPLKVKDLQIIDHIGTFYASILGKGIWRMDDSAYVVIKLCDGTRTIDDISEIIAKKTKLAFNDVKMTVKNIIDELDRLKFIEYV
jgi:hypothetical protein